MDLGERGGGNGAQPTRSIALVVSSWLLMGGSHQLHALVTFAHQIHLIAKHRGLCTP